MGGLFLATAANAASLGELRVVSSLGEKFEATVMVSVLEDESLDTACFSLEPPRIDSDVRVIKRARFELKTQDGLHVLRVLGLESESEPIARLLVRYACPQAMLVFEREYSVLLDTRENIPPTAIPASSPVLIPHPAPPAVASATMKPQRSSAHRLQRQVASRVLVRPSPVPDLGLRLQIASVPPDLSQSVPMDEKTALAMRERLLLLEADDQAAQLLQLKDRIAKLEKQLDHVADLAEVETNGAVIRQTPPATPAPASAVSKADKKNWSAGWFLSLLLLPLVGWIWRRRALAREQDAYSSIFAPTEIRAPEPVAEPAPVSDTNHDWRDDEMAVVSPGNVGEEIQLLLDHGLTAQALELLKDEIRIRPSALAMWMRLFETCAVLGDRATFAEFAARFKSQFVSEALWQEVQKLGAKLHPEEPLYREDREAELLPVTEHEPKGNDDFDLAEYLVPAVKAAKQDRHSSPSLDLPVLDFSSERADRQPDYEEFLSDDAQLSAIAELLKKRQFDESYLRLEQLLYSGTLEQRITASRWLDRLLPVRDSRD